MRVRPIFRTCAVVAGAVAMLLCGLAGGSVSHAATHEACISASTGDREQQPDLSTLATDGMVTFIGERVSVAPGSTWLDLHPEIHYWTTYFQWMRWVYPIAMTDPALATDIFIDRAHAVPDPGAAAGKAELFRTGWQEASVTARLRVGACLYALTGDERLRPAITELASAAMDPLRYYGPPRFRPHNHGLFSNIALYRAGVALNVPEWQTYATSRAQSDAGRVFDRCGLAYEQSLAYQRTNIHLWVNAGRIVGVPLVSSQTLLRAQRSVAALARPDGVVEPIGDAFPRPIAHPSGRRLICATTGWAAGTRDGAHYTLRGGPRQWAHGHEDHGSITWFAAGVPVLSDRGYSSKFDGSALAWSRSMSAHSVFEPVGVERSGRTSMEVGPMYHYLLRDEPGATSRQRAVVFGDLTIEVTDSAAVGDGLTPGAWIQHWQLAPGWTPDASGTSAIFSDGTRLDIECDGASVTFVPVSSYLADHSAVPAWDAQCAVTGVAVSLHTTLTVSAS